MTLQNAFAIAGLQMALLATTPTCQAADGIIRGRFNYDGIATCQQPAVTNFPVHAEGTASLSTDRKARLDMSTNTSGQTSYTARLGQKTESPGGSTTLNVVGRHALRAVRDYPNNIAIVTMTVIGNTCKMTLENRLKPGKHVYTFINSSGVTSMCSHIKITRTECTAY